MREREPRFTSTTSLGERGTQRFALRRVLIGATIGTIALPALAFGIPALAGILSNVPVSEIPTIANLAALQAITGMIVGGAVAAKRS